LKPPGEAGLGILKDTVSKTLAKFKTLPKFPGGGLGSEPAKVPLPCAESLPAKQKIVAAGT